MWDDLDCWAGWESETAYCTCEVGAVDPGCMIHGHYHQPENTMTDIAPTRFASRARIAEWNALPEGTVDTMAASYIVAAGFNTGPEIQLSEDIAGWPAIEKAGLRSMMGLPPTADFRATGPTDDRYHVVYDHMPYWCRDKGDQGVLERGNKEFWISDGLDAEGNEVAS